MRGNLSALFPDICAKILLPYPMRSFGTGLQIRGIKAVSTILITSVSTGFAAGKQMPAKKSFYVTSTAAHAVSAIRSAITLNGNSVRVSAGLLSSATDVTNQETNVPFQPNMITMPKLHTECIQNGFLFPVKAFPLQENSFMQSMLLLSRWSFRGSPPI